MPAITDRSTKAPLLKTGRINHGTLHCHDLAKTRRFYEEVLGMECIQTSPLSLMVRKGSDHVYACVEAPDAAPGDMNMLNHNGFEVGSPAEVDEAFQQIKAIKEEWGLKKVLPPKTTHGDHCFYFMDFDGNWWEVVCVRAGGYAADFNDKENWDLTGRHEVDSFAAEWVNDKKLRHVHDPETRELVKKARNMG
jgi:catechol 2,3-dioxygenase-like lactoylglutathione lyase family enzyme